jgi:hypothetical protein
MLLQMLQLVRHQYSSLIPASPSDLTSVDFAALLQSVGTDEMSAVLHSSSSGAEELELVVTLSATKADSMGLAAERVDRVEDAALAGLLVALDTVPVTNRAEDLMTPTEEAQQRALVSLSSSPTSPAHDDRLEQDGMENCREEVQQLQEVRRADSPCLGDMHARILLLSQNVGTPPKIPFVKKDTEGLEPTVTEI